MYAGLGHKSTVLLFDERASTLRHWLRPKTTSKPFSKTLESLWLGEGPRNTLDWVVIAVSAVSSKERSWGFKGHSILKISGFQGALDSLYIQKFGLRVP